MRTLAMFLTAFMSLTGHAKSNLEAVQLDLVPLDISVPCNRTFFRSSSHFTGTVFMTPRVVSSAGPDGDVKNSYAIFPTTKPGEYRLDVYLFFPKNDGQLRPYGASSQKRDEDTCNVDMVKKAINANRAPGQDEVKIVSRIPLTSIDVTIPGIKSIGRIGRLAEIGSLASDASQAVDFLTYSNHVLAASFLINKEEKQLFLSRVRQPDGLPAQVIFRLQGRQRDGSVHIEVNVSNLSTDLKAAINGKMKMLRAEVKTALHAAVTSRSINITAEAGTTNASNKTTADAIEAVFKSISLDIDKIPSLDGNNTDGTSDSDPISIAAVMDMVLTYDKRTVDTNFMSAQVEATDQDEVRIKATDARDSNVLDVDVKAGYIDRSSGVILEKGQTMAITIGTYHDEDVMYDDIYTDYLTPSELGELELAQHFPHLLSDKFTVSEAEPNGTLLATGTESSWGVTCGEFRWKRVQYFAHRRKNSQHVVEPGIQGLTNIPVALSFSALGNSYVRMIGNLFVDNDWWIASYDQQIGQITLTAKRDLGLVQFREMMTAKDGYITYAQEPQVSDKVIEEYRSGGWCGNDSNEETILLRDTHAITKQRVYSFSIVAPNIDAVQDVVESAKPSPIVPKVTP